MMRRTKNEKQANVICYHYPTKNAAKFVKYDVHAITIIDKLEYNKEAKAYESKHFDKIFATINDWINYIAALGSNRTYYYIKVITNEKDI